MLQGRLTWKGNFESPPFRMFYAAADLREHAQDL